MATEWGQYSFREQDWPGSFIKQILSESRLAACLAAGTSTVDKTGKIPAVMETGKGKLYIYSNSDSDKGCGATPECHPVVCSDGRALWLRGQQRRPG